MRSGLQLVVLTSAVLLVVVALVAGVRATGPSTAMFMLVTTETVGFGGGTNQTDIYRVDHAGGNLQPYIYNPDLIERFPHWSPDGEYVVFSQASRGSFGRDLALYEVDRGTVRTLTDGGTYSSPVFIPGQARIAYTVDEFSISRVGAMGLDGRDRTFLATQGGNQSRPVFSPDGETLVFTTFNQTAELWRLPMGAEKPTFLTEGSGATFGHDGAWLYFVRFSTASRPLPIILRLSMTNPDAPPQEVTRLDSRLDTLDMNASPDGRYLYFASRGVIYRVPVAGGVPEEFLARPLQQFTQPHWSPLYDLAFAGWPLVVGGVLGVIAGGGGVVVLRRR